MDPPELNSIQDNETRLKSYSSIGNLKAIRRFPGLTYPHLLRLGQAKKKAQKQMILHSILYFKGPNVVSYAHNENPDSSQNHLHRTLCCIVREFAIQGCIEASLAVNLFRGSRLNRHLTKSFARSLLPDQAWAGNSK